MSLLRYAAKRDANEDVIVKVLTKCGASVERLSGKGLPDLIVGYRGKNYLIEVKCKNNKLTEDQKIWHKWWYGQVSVVNNIEQAFNFVKMMTSE